jgi:hypothetical protein
MLHATLKQLTNALKEETGMVSGLLRLYTHMTQIVDAFVDQFGDRAPTAPPPPDEGLAELLDETDRWLRRFACVEGEFAQSSKVVFYSRSFNAIQLANYNPADIRQQLDLHMEYFKLQKAHQYKLPMYTASGIDDAEKDKQAVAEYIPSHVPEEELTTRVLQQERQKLEDQIKRVKVMNEIRHDLFDALAAAWAHIHVAWWLHARPASPTVGSLVATLPPLETTLERMFVNARLFRTMDRYISFPRSIMLTVDPVPSRVLAQPLDQIDLDTALHLLQILRAQQMFLPWYEPAFQSGILALESRLARLIVFTDTGAVMNANGLVQAYSTLATTAATTEKRPAPEDDEDEWSDEDDLDWGVADARKHDRELYCSTLFCQRIIFSTLVDIWNDVMEVQKYSDLVWVGPEPEAEAALRRYARYTWTRNTMSERQQLDLHRVLLSKYVSFGCRYFYKLEQKTGLDEDQSVAAFSWFGAVYNEIFSKMKRSPFEMLDDLTMAPILRYIIYLQTFEIELCEKGVSEFTKRYQLNARTDSLRIQSLYSYPDQQTHPYLVQFANIIGVLWKGNIFASRTNSPEAVFLHFFRIVSTHCHNQLGSVDISRVINPMCIYGEEQQFADGGGGDDSLFELLDSIPPSSLGMI